MDRMSHHRAALLAAGLFVLGLGSASAQAVSADAQAQANAPQAAVDAQAASDAQVSPDGRNDTKRPTAGCLKETGSNIRTRDPKTGKPVCIGPGRSYTREQIDRTGQTDLADALRRLDPSIH
ncbi:MULTISPECIES: hypothetical protein [unclassified Lysobacter]|uniref:hypothetical protein n=1 Tax=unclassified Lysobacter TaxID=2635362 RepID=UPI001C217E18|nr:hypothetical protein [Lysobacter sp. MMG2]MBU8975257.1 hypothetical protein [Lysobacter sp. MMG2]